MKHLKYFEALQNEVTIGDISRFYKNEFEL